MANKVIRRAVVFGLGGLGLLLPQRAEANTPFTSFAFAATGAPTSRTMPNRLAEIKNVMDFGATGDGTTDDTAAIQAAINWTSGANRGTIYFPPGSYKVTTSLTFNYAGALSIIFRGDGQASRIVGTVNGGYIFDRHLGSPSNQAQVVFEKLHIENGSTTVGTGAVRIGSTISAMIRDCSAAGMNPITTEDSAGNSSQNVLIEDVIFQSQNTATGSNGLTIGGSGAMFGCDLRGFNVAVRLYGTGFHMSGNRMERNNTAVLLGVDSADVNQGASGFSIIGGSFEGNWTSVDFTGTCSGFMLGPFIILGHDLNNAGVIPGVQGTQRGIFIRANTASAGLITGVLAGSVMDVAAFEIDAATNRSSVLFVGCAGNSVSGPNWITPSNAYTAQFLNSNVQPIYTFAGLPSGGNVLEGDEFNISDSNTASWGTNVTAGGSTNRVLTRWNGSNWTVVGK